ncbi:MAG: response regulator [Deltaproteobacteria bacterium]|nr:response regulator [Deltaproteobacteria bacterium]
MGRILVMEDDPTAQKILQSMLESLGHEVLLARNGVEGIRKALIHYPEVMTMDLEMPYMNGYQTLRILNLIGISTPVVMISESAGLDRALNLFHQVAAASSKTGLRAELPAALNKALAQAKTPKQDLDFPLGQPEIARLVTEEDRKRLLVVDDDPDTLAGVAVILEQTGLYDVFTAGGGQEALFKAAVLNPDLIVCDVMMPHIDGITLAQILYTLGRPLPIVYLSTNTQETMVKQAMKLDSVRGYWFKQDIMTRMAEFLGKVEEWTDTTPQEKNRLLNLYREIDLDKLTTSGRELGLFSAEARP